MSKHLSISQLEARQLALNAALLDGSQHTSTLKLKEVISHLGYIQIDTISVVERAHHHVLWSRFPEYKPEMIDELQLKKREIFEYWGHGMSYLPMEDYRYFRYMHKQFKNPTQKWVKGQLEKHKHLFPKILNRIKTEGELSPKDFESADGRKRSGWWDWKPAKLALELLFWQGRLMISKRVNFQKYYDLSERVLPKNLEVKIPAQRELVRFWINKGLTSLGIATFSELSKYYYHIDRELLKKELEAQVKRGEVLRVKIDSLSDTYFVRTKFFELFNFGENVHDKMYILSPFDNVLINRTRTKKLFDFDYTLECYIPEPKRKYGYFTLPLLWQGRFVGRIDIKADRASKKLMINNLFPEEPEPNETFYKLLAEELVRFKDFNSCELISFGKGNRKFKKSLLNYL